MGAAKEDKPAIIQPLHRRGIHHGHNLIGRVAHGQQRRLNGARRGAAHALDASQHAPAFQLLQGPAVGNAPDAAALQHQVAVGQGASRRSLGTGGAAKQHQGSK
ncbi:hypothetical protein GCM10023172_24950 [Hymenobacter ginsengisoli]|uniref:Uncharacterized protein n=1 Tax=Hymenobacter ginsengisoli TaxID=1051626 RepID=A0ABP8QF29_9BACT|nr:hypothetical protein [Hymenobacter sp. BT559]MBO2030245.1 hypothetical protein [Hymenobacter sp. BT559]